MLALEESPEKNFEKSLRLTDLIGDGTDSLPAELLAPTVFGTLSLLTDYVQLENTKLNSSTSEMKRDLQAFKVQAYSLMSNLMDRIDTIETKVMESRGVAPTGGEVTDNQKLDEIAVLVKHLGLQVNQIKANSETSAIKFAGIGLQSADETAAWIEIQFPSRAYGLIVDVYSGVRQRQRTDCPHKESQHYTWLKSAQHHSFSLLFERDEFIK